jgi:hypothetical protein
MPSSVAIGTQASKTAARPPHLSGHPEWPPHPIKSCRARARRGSEGKFAFDWQEFGWGCEYYEQNGKMVADDGLETLKAFDAIYFGGPSRSEPDTRCA